MHITDIPIIMEIERRAYRFHWSEGIFRDCLRVGYSCWVMLLGSKLIGYVVVSLAVWEAHLLNICVDPDYQGEGYGRELLMHAMAVARDAGADRLLLEVRPSNQSARKLYRRYGFAEVGRRHDYYPAEPGREDALVLECFL